MRMRDFRDIGVKSPDGSSEEIYNSTPSSGYLFNSTDITSMTSDYSGTWKLTVGLNSTSPSKMLEDFTLTFTMKTSPVNSDCDGDGLYDGEEATPGEDGYITDPNLADTDGDGLWDGTYGPNMSFVLSENNRRTNPTNPDTDGDGSRDGDDYQPLGNSLIRITFENAEINGTSSGWKVQGVITVSMSVGGSSVDASFVTPEVSVNSSGIANFEYSYFLDMPDDSSSVTLHLYLVRTDVSTPYLLKVDGNDTEYHEYTNANNLGYIGDTIDTIGKQANMSVHIGAFFQPKINATYFHTDDMVADGIALGQNNTIHKRYISSSSFYVLLINTTSDSSDGKYSKGYNPILVPSSIFTNSYFYKHEIEDGNGNKSWPSLTFYGDDSSADSTTAHISGLIYGNITL